MRVLLLHPEDDFPHSPGKSRWDLIVDLGRAPKSFYDDWSHKAGCEVISIFDLAVEVDDLLIWRDLLRLGIGRVVDRFGIDWWDVIGLLLQGEMQDLRLVQRLAQKIGRCESLTASRPSPLMEALRFELGCSLNTQHAGPLRQLVRGAGRYRRAAADLSFRQLRQVAYDKYDSRYVWRRKFAPVPARSSAPVVLIPSAYSNVTRAAFRYAELLPERQFLLVLARETGEVFPVPRNVRTETLAAFAQHSSDPEELRKLENDWDQLKNFVRLNPEFELSVQMGVLDRGKRLLRWGLAVRDAWCGVFERCAIMSCLCGDDSNPYSRIPLLLASQRQLPSIAFHHGALDGFMAFKAPAFSTYLVKGEMERDYLERVCKVESDFLRIGAASARSANRSLWQDQSPWIVFFTEPYETDLWRTQAIYREVVPRLCAAARAAGKKVVMKLHPFESVRQRQRMLNELLNKDERQLVSVTAAALSREILQNTWCGVTVESSTAVECATAGIPAFLCGWLRHAYVGYAQQFARFGVGQMLACPDDLLKISEMLPAAIPSSTLRDQLVSPIAPGQLAEILHSPRASNSAIISRTT
ncbi:MAG: hypothetical protein WAL71_07170 [Terriglobales bacterium]|jgi:hypothetical protein